MACYAALGLRRLPETSGRPPSPVWLAQTLRHAPAPRNVPPTLGLGPETHTHKVGVEGQRAANAGERALPGALKRRGSGQARPLLLRPCPPSPRALMQAIVPFRPLPFSF